MNMSLGNVVDAKETLIIQQADINAQQQSELTSMYPVVAAQDKKFRETCKKLQVGVFGKILPIPLEDGRVLVNLYSSDGITSYSCLQGCLMQLSVYCLMHDITSIAVPYGMACGSDGKGHWRFVLGLLHQFSEMTGICVNVYRTTEASILPEDNYDWDSLTQAG